MREKQYQQENEIQCQRDVDGYKDFVFLNRDGNPVVAGTINRALKRIVRDCNLEIMNRGEGNPVLLPDISSHTFRHTFTNRMHEASMSVKVLQRLLGHTDISMTLGIYADANDDFTVKEYQAAIHQDTYFKSQG